MKRKDHEGLRYLTVSWGYAPFCCLCDYYCCCCCCWHGVVTNGRAINCHSHSVHHVEMLEFFIACISISWPAIKIDGPPTPPYINAPTMCWVKERTEEAKVIKSDQQQMAKKSCLQFHKRFVLPKYLKLKENLLIVKPFIYSQFYHQVVLKFSFSFSIFLCPFASATIWIFRYFSAEIGSPFCAEFSLRFCFLETMLHNLRAVNCEEWKRVYQLISFLLAFWILSSVQHGVVCD